LSTSTEGTDFVRNPSTIAERLPINSRKLKLEANTGSWRPKPEVGGQNRKLQRKCRNGWELTRPTKYDF
jgi:hypothetical protein